MKTLDATCMHNPVTPKPISVIRAILYGQFLVNGPNFLLLCGPALVVAWLNQRHMVAYAAIPISIVVGCIAAWIWWAWAVPKWRLWAMQHVADLPKLQAEAVEAKLVWPRGHFFERTEIKSRQHRIAERELEVRYYLQQFHAICVTPYPVLEQALEFKQLVRSLEAVQMQFDSTGSIQGRGLSIYGMVDELKRDLLRAADVVPLSDLPEATAFLVALLTDYQQLIRGKS